MATDRTKNLNIIYLTQNQTNKEILVNEGFLKFDTLMNNGAKSISISTPPSSPEESDLYIIGDSATGDWEGHENKFTYYHSSKGWVILEPNEGMTLWVNDEDKLYSFDGANWVASDGSGDEVEKLGINATADTTNKLSVKSDAILFDNEDSNSQVKVNKNSAGDTASHLFQTNYSGRAEFGLTGSDDFTIKVSSDGTLWNDAITIDKDNAKISFNEEANFSSNGAIFPTGTFTPVIKGTTTEGSNSYSVQTGNYTLIGDRCFFDLEIALDGSSGALDSTGVIFIDGIPYQSDDESCIISVIAIGINLASGETPMLQVNSSERLVMKKQSNTDNSNVSNSDVTDDFIIKASGNYRVV